MCLYCLLWGERERLDVMHFSLVLFCCTYIYNPSTRRQKGESRDDLRLSNELVWAHQSHWSRPLTASDLTVNSGIQISRMAGDVCVFVITLSVFIYIFRPPQLPWLRVFWQKSLTRWWITTMLKASNPSVCQTTSPQEPSAPDDRQHAHVHYIYIYIYTFIYCIIHIHMQKHKHTYTQKLP